MHEEDGNEGTFHGIGKGCDAMRCDGILLDERGRGRENPARQETRRTAASADVDGGRGRAPGEREKEAAGVQFGLSITR